MSSAVHPFRHIGVRRRIALAMAVAILFAGIAQAAHYHKAELARGSTDVHCLLCLFAAGSAGPPAAGLPAPAIATRSWPYEPPASITRPQSRCGACYDARGPPLS
jgi:hypothetical protein